MDKSMIDQLLFKLQKGLPIAKRPFQAVAEEIGSSEDAVIEQVKMFFDEGTARRLGGVFDARRLGYKSSLCAIQVDEERIDEIADLITPHPGVTHCYLRGWPEELDPTLPCAMQGAYPNLWFTLAVPHDRYETDVAAIEKAIAPYELLVLPAIRRFKIDVIFDTRTRDKGESFPGAASASTSEQVESFRTFSDKEKEIVRLLDGNIKVAQEPYKAIAEKTGISIDELLDLLSQWNSEGIIRRIALILRHHKIGFKANAMCTWSRPEDNAIESGRALAANPEVTHCYQRVVYPSFPYNIFAMIHTQSWEDTHELFKKIGSNAGLSGGKMLCSVREFKKTSMKYFAESTRE